MSIYDIDYEIQGEALMPPDKRKPKLLGWLFSFLYALQLLRDRFFNYYADGFTGDSWDVSTAYVVGDEVRYIDRAVYECIQNATAGTLPTDTDYFVKIQDVYIGLRERLKYNSRKIVLEFILNKWFEVDPLPSNQIYIQNNNIYGTAFIMGASGQTSSTMASNSIYQQYFLGNSYTFNAYAFTIFVPTAVFNALDPDATNAENIIRAIADKYVIAGMEYDVQTY